MTDPMTMTVKEMDKLSLDDQYQLGWNCAGKGIQPSNATEVFWEGYDHYIEMNDIGMAS
jgi:hypothetical protein